MKPKNFPGRKNLRRIEAKKRILKKYKDKILDQQTEYLLDNLNKKILPQHEAEMIETKISRRK